MNSKFNTCSGPSMYPTLRNGDGLIIEDYKDKTQLRVGDVIVYFSHEKMMDIVHRIIRLESEGVIARGDNNDKLDPFVKFEEIRGIVRQAKRNNITFEIYGGKKGLVIHKIALLRKGVSKTFIPVAKALIDTVERSNILKLMHNRFKIKIVHLSSVNGDDAKMLVSGNKVIGKYCPHENSWNIRYRYKPFIDKTKIEIGNEKI